MTASPPLLIRIYIRDMVPGKKYLIRRRDYDADDETNTGNIYATYINKFYPGIHYRFGYPSRDTHLYSESYLREILLPDILEESKKIFEEDEEYLDEWGKPIKFDSLKDYVFDYDYGLGYVFYALAIKYNIERWGCGFFSPEQVVDEKIKGYDFFKHKLLSEEHFRFYEIPCAEN